MAHHRKAGPYNGGSDQPVFFQVDPFTEDAPQYAASHQSFIPRRIKGSQKIFFIGFPHIGTLHQKGLGRGKVQPVDDLIHKLIRRKENQIISLFG